MDNSSTPSKPLSKPHSLNSPRPFMNVSDPGRRGNWQKTLRELAAPPEDNQQYNKTIRSLGGRRCVCECPLEEREASQLVPLIISEVTSSPKPIRKAMSSTIAIPPLQLNGKGKGKELDLFSADAIRSLGEKLNQQRLDFPPIDTHGGEIAEVTEADEVDPNDGCRVQVLTYRILMPDKMTELTKTIRRKFQMDCTHMYSRVHLVNGQEVGLETTTSRMQRDIKGFAPIEVTNHKLQLDENNAQDAAISAVLRQAHSRMQGMFSVEKEKLIALYPQLFKSLGDIAPSGQQKEIIHNPDGTVTERSSTKKSFSTHFSKCETFVGGKKQQSRVRAFVQYAGPEGGFKVKLANGDENELSEEEEDSEYDNKSSVSEIPDDESMVVLGSRIPPVTVKKSQKHEKRMEKAWHAAKELVDSEQRYVDKLRLLEETFRKRIVVEGALEKDKILRLFANTESLFTFHNQHLLPQLLVASREWCTTKRISSVMRKLAPFLKMYSDYTNNYKRACKTFEEAMAKKKKFADIVREVEKDPACENLPLISHLICPVQRVMRYQLLLQEYKKHLVESDADYADTTTALDLVMEAASHANDMMKKLDRYGKVIEVQEQLGNTISLVSPGREFLRSGPLHKISSSTGKTEERMVFLFNDLIILASESGLLGFAKYKLRAIFDAAHTQVCEGDNLEREYSFYLRGSYGGAQQRTLELFTENQKDKEEWVQAICHVVDDSSHTLAATSNGAGGKSSERSEKNCAECDCELGFLVRGIRCSQCEQKLCKKCFGRYWKEAKSNRVCEGCAKHMGGSARTGMTPSTSTMSSMRRDVLAVPASLSQEKDLIILHASPVKFRASQGKIQQRYFVIRSNFCLYSYTSPNDERALTMLPLPGCEVKMTGEKCTFSLRCGSRRLYLITAEDDESQARWMAALDLAANAQFGGSSSSASDTCSVSSR